MTIKVKVTQNNIDDGRISNRQIYQAENPIALALVDALAYDEHLGNLDISVRTHSIELYNHEMLYKGSLPSNASSFLKLHKQGLDVKPFEFELPHTDDLYWDFYEYDWVKVDRF